MSQNSTGPSIDRLPRLSREELAQQIYGCSHLTGQFLLRSGKTSTEYFDKYQFESRPELLIEIAAAMLPLLPKNTELLGALEMGGIPIATAISLLSGVPVVFVRKTAKDYGTCKFAEGPSVKGKQITLIEDVITTGGQVAMSASDLRQDGGVISDVLCVIDRSDGPRDAPGNKLTAARLTLTALFTMAELKSHA